MSVLFPLRCLWGGLVCWLPALVMLGLLRPPVLVALLLVLLVGLRLLALFLLLVA